MHQNENSSFIGVYSYLHIKTTFWFGIFLEMFLVLVAALFSLSLRFVLCKDCTESLFLKSQHRNYMGAKFNAISDSPKRTIWSMLSIWMIPSWCTHINENKNWKFSESQFTIQFNRFDVLAIYTSNMAPQSVC